MITKEQVLNLNAGWNWDKKYQSFEKVETDETGWGLEIYSSYIQLYYIGDTVYSGACDTIEDFLEICRIAKIT